MIIIQNIINILILFSYWILICFISMHVLIKHRTVSSVIAWLLIIYITPIIGIIIYLLCGELNLDTLRKKRSKIIYPFTINWIKKLKKYRRTISKKYSKTAQSLFKLCENRQGIGGIKTNYLRLFNNIDDTINALIEDIQLATKTINIIFYIWDHGGKVNKIIDALIAAAHRGVCCRIILDSAGSKNFLNSKYYAIMQKAGIHIVKALHINFLRIFLRRMDLRQHRKMILIDNYISYTGSMNMVDPNFFKQNIGIGKWIDIMVRMEGLVTQAMEIIFSCDWEIETGEHIPLNILNNKIKINKSKNHTIQVIASGPNFPEGMIRQVLLTSLYAAQKQLIITTPYFVPSEDLLHAICTAAQRGVKVQIIIPKYNDSLLVNWASRFFFTELIKSGVLIYQFKEGLLHTKSILIDRQLSLIGTVNLDMRSLWINLEIILIIDSINFNNELATIQKNYILKSHLIDRKQWINRPYWHRIIEKLFYLLSPLL